VASAERDEGGGDNLERTVTETVRVDVSVERKEEGK